MIKFSFSAPNKSLKRLNQAPQTSDLQSMLTEAMENSGKDIGIVWSQDRVEFSLLLRHSSGQVLWRLMSGNGFKGELLWSSDETSLRSVFGKVLARCNDVCRPAGAAAPTAQPQASIKPQSPTAVPPLPTDRNAPASVPAAVPGQPPLHVWQNEGELAFARMFSLLQSLGEQRVSGKLSVIAAEDVGDVYFENGRLIHATTSESVGEDSILEIVCWDQGQYRFDARQTTAERTINASIGQLMLKDMELLAQASELEARGITPSTIIARQNEQLGHDTLQSLMQKSAPLQRMYLSLSSPLCVGEIIEQLRLPRAQFVAALHNLVVSGLVSHWNEASSDESPLLNEFAFAQDLRAKPTDEETVWFQALVTPPRVIDRDLANQHPAALDDQTKAFMQLTFALMSGYLALFNRLIIDRELAVTFTDQGQVSERVPVGNVVSDKQYYRWRISTMHWSLCARASRGTFELFLMPARDTVALSAAEFDYRRRLRLDLLITARGSFWMTDHLPLSSSELRSLLRNSFQDLIRTTVRELELEAAAFSDQVDDQPQTAAGGLRQIVLEKQNLAHKIVSQQEEIQRRIARDLHDAVIADVTMLKRSLTPDTSVTREQIVQSLDQITARLREICYDLSPSDLRDWGLQTTIEALLDQVQTRTGAQCSLVCNCEIPLLESSVELHIFRIIQECLNNSAKYSGAKSVVVQVDRTDLALFFTMQDDGKGFDPNQNTPRHSKDGGMGMSSMQERLELIRCFYQAKLELKSEPGQGTMVRLAIKLPK